MDWVHGNYLLNIFGFGRIFRLESPWHFPYLSHRDVGGNNNVDDDDEDIDDDDDIGDEWYW